MHYNIIKTAAGARTRLRLPMVWKADAVAAEELPEAVFWVFIGGERVRVEKTPHSEDEYVFPALQAGQYAWDLVVDSQVVLHGVLKVRGSAVPPGGGEVCGTLLVDAPAMVLVLSPGPRGEVGPVGPQGLSAYEVALQHGYEGSEDDWAEELSGAQAAATAAKEQATAAGNSATAAAASATTAGKQATAAANSATAAAGSATTAKEQATAAGNSATAAASSATTAGAQASAAEGSAKAAASSATTAGAQARAADASAKAAASSATTAGAQASAAEGSAKAAAGSATTASEQATAAANSAKAADSSATTAREQATAAANSATAAATAADAVKYDLLPMSVDWLHTQFVQEIGDGNFTVRLNEEQKTLNVSFAHDIPEEQCESLLQLCRRVTPQIVGVVREAVPTDYTEIEYLESSGSQYILLPDSFITTADFSFALEAQQTKATPGYWQHFFGERSGNFDTGAALSDTVTCVVAWRATVDMTVAEFERFSIFCDASKVEVNGVVTEWDNSANVGREMPYLRVFDKFGSRRFIGRVFNVNVRNAGAALYDLVPVLDDTGAPGFYDRKNRAMYYNAGAGDFLFPSPVTTYSLRRVAQYVPEYAQLTPRGVRRLYRVPAGYAGSVAEYAAEHGFKRLVESEKPADGYWSPEWRETETELRLEWQEMPEPQEEFLTE